MAVKGNKYALGNKGGGRKPSFKQEYIELAYNYALLGAKDVDLATFFDVSEQTINNWKKQHKEFFLALKKGKHEADASIANSLYHRAKGYTHKEEKIFVDKGEVIRVETEKHYPPDTAAMFIWLKNRRPDLWRDKQEVDHTTKGDKIDLSHLSFEELMKLKNGSE